MLLDVEDALSSLDSKTSFDSNGVANVILNKCYIHCSLPLFMLLKKLLSSLASFWTDAKFQNLFQYIYCYASKSADNSNQKFQKILIKWFMDIVLYLHLQIIDFGIS